MASNKKPVTEIVGILLAAGSARRFGSPKLLHPLDEGVSVAAAAAQTLMQVLPNTIAVVKPGDYPLIGIFRELGLHIVENPLADEGMGSSLAAGVSAADSADGWLIALADMPWIQPATIAAVAGRLADGASMVTPVFGGRRGHPVGLSARWLQPLLSLCGDVGARELIANHQQELELLDLGDAGVLKDIDYPQDLSR